MACLLAYSRQNQFSCLNLSPHAAWLFHLSSPTPSLESCCGNLTSTTSPWLRIIGLEQRCQRHGQQCCLLQCNMCWNQPHMPHAARKAHWHRLHTAQGWYEMHAACRLSQIGPNDCRVQCTMLVQHGHHIQRVPQTGTIGCVLADVPCAEPGQAHAACMWQVGLEQAHVLQATPTSDHPKGWNWNTAGLWAQSGLESGLKPLIQPRELNVFDIPGLQEISRDAQIRAFESFNLRELHFYLDLNLPWSIFK